MTSRDVRLFQGMIVAASIFVALCASLPSLMKWLQISEINHAWITA
jgi:hypothetical protein